MQGSLMDKKTRSKEMGSILDASSCVNMTTYESKSFRF